MIDARDRDRIRTAALAAIRRGHLTIAEVADLIGVSRQLVRYWCQTGRVRATNARARYCAAEWRQALRQYVNE